MSGPEEEQQHGPAVKERPEPRLLTRPVPSTSQERHPPAVRRQKVPEKGLSQWAKRLRANRKPLVSPKRVRRLRVWRNIAAVTIAVLLLAAVGGVLYLRHALTASLPQLDGSETVQGLMAPVTVTRDSQGVPSISATNLDDLLFAQGYVTASDRLWQMDALRRHAAGELAEILGPGLVEHDRRQRFLQLRAAADRAVAQLPADQFEQLQAYAKGVNAYLQAHSGKLPLEFHLLAYSPQAWSPRDSLLVSLAMAQDLSTEFPQKINREAFSRHLPQELLADLYPIGSWRDQPPAAQSRDLTSPREVEQIPLDPSQSRLQPEPAGPKPEQLVAVSTALASTKGCEDCRSGSNNWAVSGAHTASGAPLLSNDMHLNLSLPDIWYEAALHAPLATAPGTQMDVTGFTLPGVPFVIVGRNAHVAWGVTNLGADVQDLRVEHLRGSGAETEYERPDGTWSAANHQSEHIRVRGGRDVVLDVLTTTHSVGQATMETPIISPLYPGEKRALSLAWNVYDPANVRSPLLSVNTAQDGNALVAGWKDLGLPSLNLVWADSGGHIGYHATGRIPVRGPAVQRARAVETPVVPDPGAAMPDDSVEEPQPEAILSFGPHLVLSAYRPVQRRAAPTRSNRAAQRPKATRDLRSAHRQGGREVGHLRLRRPAPLPVETPEPVLPMVSATPSQPKVNYTIGSPIAPVPVDALDTTQEWTEYIPYDALPSAVDPSGGFLATANARITPDDYPYAIADNWADPFRVERIVHFLSGRRGLTAADMLRLQNDVQSDVNLILGQRIAYAIDHASNKALGANAAKLRQAANLLRAWDGRMTAESPAAALVSAVRPSLWQALLVPQIRRHDGNDEKKAAATAALYSWGERTTALELLVQNTPARWLPEGFADWNDFLASTTAKALAANSAPGDLSRWKYGDGHKVEISHPVLGTQGLIGSLLSATASTGAQPAPGDATTVDAIGAHFGPSERFTADLSSADAAMGNITTGQSANPRSPWYLDQFRPWLHGTTFSLPVTGAEIAHTLTLTPR